MFLCEYSKSYTINSLKTYLWNIMKEEVLIWCEIHSNLSSCFYIFEIFWYFFYASCTLIFCETLWGRPHFVVFCLSACTLTHLCMFLCFDWLCYSYSSCSRNNICHNCIVHIIFQPRIISVRAHSNKAEKLKQKRDKNHALYYLFIVWRV